MSKHNEKGRKFPTLAQEYSYYLMVTAMLQLYCSISCWCNLIWCVIVLRMSISMSQIVPKYSFPKFWTNSTDFFFFFFDVYSTLTFSIKSENWNLPDLRGSEVKFVPANTVLELLVKHSYYSATWCWVGVCALAWVEGEIWCHSTKVNFTGVWTLLFWCPVTSIIKIKISHQNLKCSFGSPLMLRPHELTNEGSTPLCAHKRSKKVAFAHAIG